MKRHENQFELEPSVEGEKPSILYHASSNRGVEEFKPRNKSIRDAKEGPVIFATPDFGLAATFMVDTSDGSWTKISRFKEMVWGNLSG